MIEKFHEGVFIYFISLRARKCSLAPNNLITQFIDQVKLILNELIDVDMINY